MKPDWDRLMAEYEGSKTTLIADVDCTAGGESLCSEKGVGGYPTIKFGDPNALEDYSGGRDFDALKKFAAENLGPTCGPNNMDLCDADQKALIKKFQAMSAEELDAAIKEKTDSMDKLENEFKVWVEGLSAQYDQQSATRDKEVAEVKNSGLGMMKVALAHLKAKQEL